MCHLGKAKTKGGAPGSVRLSDHEMKMLGHYDMTQHLEAVTRAPFIQHLYEDITRTHRSHEWLSLITTAGDVVVVVKTVDSDQIARHAANYRRELLDNPLIYRSYEWVTWRGSMPSV